MATMDLIRRITVESRSQGVAETTRDLNQLATAQTKVGTAGQATATITEMTSRKQLSAAAAVDRLRLSMDAAYRAQRMLEQGQLKIDRGMEQGILTTQEYAHMMDLLQARFRASTMVMGASVRQVTANSRQLMFQLVDIGQAIPLAFQSPIYALQNLGFQIAQIGQLYAGQGGMKAALTDSIGMVGRFAARLGPVGLAVGAVGLAIGGMQAEINKASGVSVSFGDTALATWQVVAGGIYSILQPAIAAITPWFAEQWNIFVADVKVSGNQVIGIFVGAYEFILSVWRNLPAALSGFAKEAVNGIAEALNKPLLTFGDKTLIGGLGLPAMDLSDAERSAVAGAKGSFGNATSRDYMGGLFGGIEQRAIANSQRISEKDQAKAAADAARESERQAKAYESLVRGAQQFIAAQEMERQALGMTRTAAARFRHEQELMNKAANDNLVLTPKQTAELQRYAAAMAEAEVRTSRIKEAMDFAREVAGGFVDTFRSGLQEGKGVWESFANAATDALDRISQKLLDMALDQAINSLFGNLLGSIGGGGVSQGGPMPGTPWSYGSFAAASGGMVWGPGTGTSDSILARVSNGEFIVNAASTAAYRPFLESINSFADGGAVEPSPSVCVGRPGGFGERLAA